MNMCYIVTWKPLLFGGCSVSLPTDFLSLNILKYFFLFCLKLENKKKWPSMESGAGVVCFDDSNEKLTLFCLRRIPFQVLWMSWKNN